LVVFEKVGAGSAFRRKPRLPPCIEPRLDIKYEVRNALRHLLEDAVGVDDPVFCVVGVRILHDDDGAAMLYLVVVKGVPVFEGKLDVLAEETDVLLSEVLVLVVVLLLEQLLLELVCADPREELQLEPATLVDHVLEAQLDLLYHVLRVCLQVPEL
jgi:hypothetical protein